MKHVWILLSLPIFLTACTTERLVEVPVPVEIVRTETAAIPDDLTEPVEKAVVSESMTYGEALAAWADDRASVDVANAKLKAIRKISAGTNRD